MMPVKELEKQVVGVIRKLQPGTRLQPERELAMQFGVSRTALREVLQYLENKGAITRKRKLGTFVNHGASKKILPTITIPRKDVNEMEPGSSRRIRNAVAQQLQDHIGSTSERFHLTTAPYDPDHRKMRNAPTPTTSMISGVYLQDALAFNLCHDVSDLVREWRGAVDIRPNLWEAVTSAGHTFGIPASAHVFMLFVNRRILEKAGFSAAPANWSELMEAAKAMTVPKKSLYGLGLPYGYRLPWFFGDLCLQAGGSIIECSGDQWQPVFHNEPGVRALSFLQKLRWQEGVVYPAQSALEMFQEFLHDRIGMCFMEAAAGLQAVAAANLDFEHIDLAPLPAGPFGHTICQVSILAHFINAGAPPEEQEAGWEFLKEWVNQDCAARLGANLWKHKIVSNWPSIFRNMTVRETHVELPERWFHALENSVSRARPEPSGHGWDSSIYLAPVLRKVLDHAEADPAVELNQVAQLAKSNIGFLR